MNISVTISSTKRYPDGTSVNDVLEILQDKYGMADNFDRYIDQNISRFRGYKTRFNNTNVNRFLTKLFREYITLRKTGIKYKNKGIEFIDTGLMISSVSVNLNQNLQELITKEDLNNKLLKMIL